MFKDEASKYVIILIILLKKCSKMSKKASLNVFVKDDSSIKYFSLCFGMEIRVEDIKYTYS